MSVHTTIKIFFFNLKLNQGTPIDSSKFPDQDINVQPTSSDVNDLRINDDICIFGAS